MKRIDERTVELTPKEMEATEHFEAMLDTGMGIFAAVRSTQMAYSGLDEDFYVWLSGPDNEQQIQIPE